MKGRFLLVLFKVACYCGPTACEDELQDMENQPSVVTPNIFVVCDHPDITYCFFLTDSVHTLGWLKVQRRFIIFKMGMNLTFR